MIEVDFKIAHDRKPSKMIEVDFKIAHHSIFTNTKLMKSKLKDMRKVFEKNFLSDNTMYKKQMV
jgi:hypothetical protein